MWLEEFKRGWRGLLGLKGQRFGMSHKGSEETKQLHMWLYGEVGGLLELFGCEL